MRNQNGKLVGIIGTVIIHLIAAIFFMSFKIRELKTEQYENLNLEFAPVEQEENKEKIIELPSTNIERILQGNEELLNIARNLASKPEEQINPADYIDKVKEELIQSGQLGPNNYIDEQKRMLETTGEENPAVEEKKEEVKEDKLKESLEMEANYKGPTRIYYDLAGRNHTYLPVPIYKCEGSGKIALSIIVNQNGDVEEAKVIAGESTTTDLCLLETAVSTALISRFNPDVNSPKEQKGTLTYHFVAQ